MRNQQGRPYDRAESTCRGYKWGTALQKRVRLQYQMSSYLPSGTESESILEVSVEACSSSILLFLREDTQVTGSTGEGPRDPAKGPSSWILKMTLPHGSLLPPRGQGFCCAGAQVPDRDKGVNPAEHASCALENEMKFTPGGSLSSCLPSVLIDIPALSEKGTVFLLDPLIIRVGYGKRGDDCFQREQQNSTFNQSTASRLHTGSQPRE